MSPSPPNNDRSMTDDVQTSRSSFSTVRRLVRKDLYLNRWLIAGSWVAAFVALGLLAGGSDTSFFMGGVLLVTVLIGLGAILATHTVVEESQHQTFPFIMSLPVSTRQVAASKILANALGFGSTWSLLLLGALGLIMISDDLSNGLVVYALIILTEVAMSTCLILAVAMATHSLPWTIGVMVCGNLFFNGFLFSLFRTPTFLATAESPNIVWPSEALAMLYTELAGIVLLLGIAYVVSARRKDIL